VNEAELLERLDAALRAAGGEVELSAQAMRIGATRFANSRVTQSSDVDDVVVQARVREGGLGAARTNALDGDSLAQAIARAREIAHVAPSDAPGFADGSAPLPPVPPFDDETARAGAERRADLVAPAFAVARGGAAGLAATSDVRVAVATSAGARRAHRATTARLEVIVADGAASGRAARIQRAIGSIDARAIADDARRRADRARDPIELPPGAYDAILEPPAVAELLEWLALTSFGARQVDDGSSCLAGRAGQRITGDVTFVDDAAAGEEGAPERPFDAEGSPSARLSPIAGGVAGSPAHDRASGARAGAASTGHAIPVADELFDSGPVPQHLQMLGGADDEPALLARVERGLWVSRFHYVNGLLDTRRALMTGMTRDGLFLVENGRISRPVRNLRWTESVLEAFGRIGGIGRARSAVAASLGDSVFVCPTVLVRGWRFTDGA
jgi:predicted Zn-dependent protease